MTAKTLIEELVETIDKLPGTIGGKWKLGYTGSDIGCENEKIGGFAKLLDIRGWGYLTGTGHGALGLSQDEGAVVQRLYSQHVVNCSPDNIRTIAEAFRKLEQERDELRRAVEWQPIETAPWHTDVLVYSEEGGTGVLLAQFTSLRGLLSDGEIDDLYEQGMTEDEIDANAWFYCDFGGGARLEADCAPSRWRPLPPEDNRLALNPERAEGGE